MPAFVGLLYDPREEITNIFPALWQHSYWDHIQHLYGLIEFSVEASQIDSQQQQITDNREGEI